MLFCHHPFCHHLEYSAMFAVSQGWLQSHVTETLCPQPIMVTDANNPSLNSVWSFVFMASPRPADSLILPEIYAAWYCLLYTTWRRKRHSPCCLFHKSLFYVKLVTSPQSHRLMSESASVLVRAGEYLFFH